MGLKTKPENCVGTARTLDRIAYLTFSRMRSVMESPTVAFIELPVTPYPRTMMTTIKCAREYNPSLDLDCSKAIGGGTEEPHSTKGVVLSGGNSLPRAYPTTGSIRREWSPTSCIVKTIPARRTTAKSGAIPNLQNELNGILMTTLTPTSTVQQPDGTVHTSLKDDSFFVKCALTARNLLVGCHLEG